RGRQAAAELAALHAALVNDPQGAYPETMLVDQLEYLYGMTTSADQPPGADAYRRLETLTAELDALTSRLERLVQSQLSEVEAAGRPN
ncbi:MAG TPA: hypothetical protein VLC48_05645, partial [Gemmatimonadota bacterium]|nr:hypothetical protein [Gemmatimonadota bacterium]